jgi:hypothetical protein
MNTKKRVASDIAHEIPRSNKPMFEKNELLIKYPSDKIKRVTNQRR